MLNPAKPGCTTTQAGAVASSCASVAGLFGVASATFCVCRRWVLTGLDAAKTKAGWAGQSFGSFLQAARAISTSGPETQVPSNVAANLNAALGQGIWLSKSCPSSPGKMDKATLIRW